MWFVGIEIRTGSVS